MTTRGDLAWTQESGTRGVMALPVIQKTRLFGLTPGQDKLVLGSHARVVHHGSGEVNTAQAHRHQDLHHETSRHKMKSYFYGLLGCLTALALYLFFQAQYSDYRAKAETEGLVFKMEALQRSLEDVFQKTGKFDSVMASKTINQSDGPKPIILENGTIIVRGRIEGQLLVLAPKVEGGKVQWRCYVGPDKARPSNCRSE
jgi:hypothetical protein